MKLYISLAEQAGYSPKDLYVIVAKTGTSAGAIQQPETLNKRYQHF